MAATQKQKAARHLSGKRGTGKEADVPKLGPCAARLGVSEHSEGQQ